MILSDEYLKRQVIPAANPFLTYEKMIMKHLFFALSIALLTSSVATTAWSQQTEPTEQEPKISLWKK